MLTRRRAIIGAIGTAPMLAVAGSAMPAPALKLVADDGSRIPNRRVDHRILIASLSHALRIGPADADVTIVEFFDYNCSYCKAAVRDLDRIVTENGKVSLILVHCPILSPVSQDAAIVQQAVFRHDGPHAAYDLHLSLLQSRGMVTGPRVRGALGNSPALAQANLEAAAADVSAMRTLCTNYGVRAVPTFVIGDTALIGWPGLTGATAMLAAARSCGIAKCA